MPICLSLLSQGVWISSQSETSSSALRGLGCQLVTFCHGIDYCLISPQPVSFRNKLTLNSFNLCILLALQNAKVFCILLGGKSPLAGSTTWLS